MLAAATIALLTAQSGVQGPTQDEIFATLRAVNYYRRLAGLPAAKLNPQLSKAAQSHAEYRVKNWGTENAHRQTVGLEGFTGVTSGDRIKASGYTGRALGECMSFGESRGPDSVSNLVRVPFHRLPFVRGEILDIGIGKAADTSGRQPRRMTTWVYNFGGTQAAVAVWPADGAAGVRPSGSVKESPDPMAIHGAPGDGVGYVVSAAFDQANLRFRSASLTDSDGVTTPIYVNHPENDKSSPRSVLMIPKKPLRPNTTYTAKISLVWPSGNALDRQWRFTTGTETRHFEYTNAVARFPEVPTGGRKYTGVVNSISADDRSIVIEELTDATVKSTKPSKITRTFALTDASKLRHAIDPLGVDYDRANPAKGARVVFTAAPGKPESVHELLVLR
jgi:uncharacterized protein YkwD